LDKDDFTADALNAAEERLRKEPPGSQIPSAFSSAQLDGQTDETARYRYDQIRLGNRRRFYELTGRRICEIIETPSCWRGFDENPDIGCHGKRLVELPDEGMPTGLICPHCGDGFVVDRSGNLFTHFARERKFEYY